jgi:hypothetical protein
MSSAIANATATFPLCEGTAVNDAADINGCSFWINRQTALVKPESESAEPRSDGTPDDEAEFGWSKRLDDLLESVRRFSE